MSDEFAPNGPEQGEPERTGNESRNLFEDENFRKLQAGWQRKIEEARQLALAKDNQIAQLAQQVQALEERGLDDDEKQQLALRRAEAKLAQLERERQEQEELQRMMQQRDMDIRLLIETHDLPASAYDKLAEMENYKEAVKLAVKLSKEQTNDSGKSRDDQRSPAMPRQFVGGTMNPAQASSLDAQIQAAKKSANPARELAKLLMVPRA